MGRKGARESASVVRKVTVLPPIQEAVAKGMKTAMAPIRMRRRRSVAGEEDADGDVRGG